MAKNDWIEVLEIFNNKNENYLDRFLKSTDKFSPSSVYINIFNKDANAFSSSLLNKQKPGNWIPIYKKEDLPEYFIINNLMPIRCGQAEFFFFKGDIFYDLTITKFATVEISSFGLVDCFMPLTLENFQKNENAYLNKGLSLGILNHFIDDGLSY